MVPHVSPLHTAQTTSGALESILNAPLWGYREGEGRKWSIRVDWPCIEAGRDFSRREKPSRAIIVPLIHK